MAWKKETSIEELRALAQKNFGVIGNFFIKYKDIKNVQSISLGSYEEYCIKINEKYLFSSSKTRDDRNSMIELFGKKSIKTWDDLKKFLDVVKNF